MYRLDKCALIPIYFIKLSAATMAITFLSPSYNIRQQDMPLLDFVKNTVKIEWATLHCINCVALIYIIIIVSKTTVLRHTSSKQKARTLHLFQCMSGTVSCRKMHKTIIFNFLHAINFCKFLEQILNGFLCCAELKISNI